MYFIQCLKARKNKGTILRTRLKSQLSSFWTPFWEMMDSKEPITLWGIFTNIFSLLKRRKTDRGIVMGMIYAHLFSEGSWGCWNPSPWECHRSYVVAPSKKISLFSSNLQHWRTTIPAFGKPEIPNSYMALRFFCKIKYYKLSCQMAK